MNALSSTLIAILAIFASGILYMSAELDRKQNQIDEYQSTIQKLELEAEQQAENFKEYQDEADGEMVKVKQEQAKILADKVPQKCQDAMKWAILQARQFA